jgi:hypothetical protein
MSRWTKELHDKTYGFSFNKRLISKSGEIDFKTPYFFLVSLNDQKSLTVEVDNIISRFLKEQLSVTVSETSNIQIRDGVYRSFKKSFRQETFTNSSNLDMLYDSLFNINEFNFIFKSIWNDVFDEYFEEMGL